MPDGHLAGIWVEGRSQTLTLCGNLAALDPFVGEATAGYGLEGQLVAAAVCARSGADGAFLRRQPKAHGTKQRYDGALAASTVERVFCSRNDEQACIDTVSELNVSHAQIVTFDVQRSSGSFADLTIETALPAADPLSLADAVILLRGQFTLSSGKSSNGYWETLPAANRFRVARNLDVTDSDASRIVGVGYGGSYIATIVALTSGRQPFVVDPSVSGSETLDGPAIVFDDFVTTGASFTRALAAVPFRVRSVSSCVALYGAARAAPSLDWVRVLHTLP